MAGSHRYSRKRRLLQLCTSKSSAYNAHRSFAKSNFRQPRHVLQRHAACAQRLVTPDHSLVKRPSSRAVVPRRAKDEHPALLHRRLLPASSSQMQSLTYVVQVPPRELAAIAAICRGRLRFSSPQICAAAARYVWQRSAPSCIVSRRVWWEAGIEKNKQETLRPESARPGLCHRP